MWHELWMLWLQSATWSRARTAIPGCAAPVTRARLRSAAGTPTRMSNARPLCAGCAALTVSSLVILAYNAVRLRDTRPGLDMRCMRTLHGKWSSKIKTPPVLSACLSGSTVAQQVPMHFLRRTVCHTVVVSLAVLARCATSISLGSPCLLRAFAGFASGTCWRNVRRSLARWSAINRALSCARCRRYSMMQTRVTW
jgi:hypothetical protein